MLLYQCRCAPRAVQHARNRCPVASESPNLTLIFYNPGQENETPDGFKKIFPGMKHGLRSQGQIPIESVDRDSLCGYCVSMAGQRLSTFALLVRNKYFIVFCSGNSSGNIRWSWDDQLEWIEQILSRNAEQ